MQSPVLLGAMYAKRRMGKSLPLVLDTFTVYRESLPETVD